MIYLCRNPKGFLRVHLFLFLGLFSTLVFSFAFLAAVAQAKMKFRKQCYEQSISLQKEIISAEKRLFDLNFLSSLLYAEELLALARLAVPATAAQAAQDLERIKNEQRELDLVQKSIIRGADVLILTKVAFVEYRLITDSFDQQNVWRPFLNLFFNVRPLRRPQMSVKALSDRLAPNYGLKESYKTDQTVAFKWQLDISINKEAQSVTFKPNRALLEQTDFRFEETCMAIPNKSEKSWNIEIEKDKF